MRKGAKSEEDEDSLDNGLAPGTSMESRKAGKKIPVTSCFMEDENGMAIPETQKSAARAKAKSFWVKLFNKGEAPTSYSKASIDIQDEYIALMENNFPWLRYCEAHWKSAQIWRINYSDWLITAEKDKAKREKAEKEKAAAEGKVIDVDADDNSQDNQNVPSKRPQVDGETSDPKRPRIEEDKPTPPTRPAPTKITTKRARVRFMYIAKSYALLTMFRRTCCTKILNICALGSPY